MAVFSNKIVTAKFLDYPNNTVIEVLYEEDEQLISFSLEVDFTQDDFNELVKEISLDEIETISKEEYDEKRKEAQAFLEQQINEKVEKQVAEIWEKDKARIKSDLAKEYQESFVQEKSLSLDELPSKDIFNHLIKKNEDLDFLFDLKIHILEDADITKSKDKTLKLSIRKAKTVLQLIKIYEEFKGTL
jgi:hypothetical protein